MKNSTTRLCLFFLLFPFAFHFVLQSFFINFLLKFSNVQLLSIYYCVTLRWLPHCLCVSLSGSLSLSVCQCVCIQFQFWHSKWHVPVCGSCGIPGDSRLDTIIPIKYIKCFPSAQVRLRQSN